MSDEVAAMPAVAAAAPAAIAQQPETPNNGEEIYTGKDGRKIQRKRAPYGKRGLNQGVLATTNGALDDVIGISPFGIYCKGCKTKIAFSTFKNHIRDAHPTCFTPSSVNYAAVSREYERLVEETKTNIILADSKTKTTDGQPTITESMTSTSSEELLNAYLDGADIVDRFQCTSCNCLFDNKSNAKRHFLSMKTGCQEAALTIVKCRKTVCCRAITLTDVDKMKRDAALAVVDNAYSKHQQRLLEERQAAQNEEEDGSTPKGRKKRKSPAAKQKTATPKKKIKSEPKTPTPKKKAVQPKKKRPPPAPKTPQSSDDERKYQKPPPSPPGERSSSRLRKRRRDIEIKAEDDDDQDLSNIASVIV